MKLKQETDDDINGPMNTSIATGHEQTTDCTNVNDDTNMEDIHN